MSLDVLAVLRHMGAGTYSPRYRYIPKRMIKAILCYGTISDTDTKSIELLAFAALGDRADIVDQCIRSGCDVNPKDQYAYRYVLPVQPPLSCASCPVIVNKLLDAKARVDDLRIHSITAACENFEPESVQLLLDARAWFEEELDCAMAAHCPDDRIDDKIAVLNMLVDAGLNRPGQGGFIDRYKAAQALYTCTRLCRDAKVDVIIKALAKRYPVMLRHRDDCMTPLACFEACTSQYVAKYNALVEAGADVRGISHLSNLATVIRLGKSLTNAEIKAILNMFIDLGVDVTEIDKYVNDIDYDIIELDMDEQDRDRRGMSLLMYLVCRHVDDVDRPDSDTRILCHDIINHVLSRPLASATDNGASSTGTGTGTGGGNAEPEPSSRASALSSSSRPMPERTADRKRHKSTQ
jgi:hypothetical protein